MNNILPVNGNHQTYSSILKYIYKKQSLLIIINSKYNFPLIYIYIHFNIGQIFHYNSCLYL